MKCDILSRVRMSQRFGRNKPFMLFDVFISSQVLENCNIHFYAPQERANCHHSHDGARE